MLHCRTLRGIGELAVLETSATRWAATRVRCLLGQTVGLPGVDDSSSRVLRISMAGEGDAGAAFARRGGMVDTSAELFLGSFIVDAGRDSTILHPRASPIPETTPSTAVAAATARTTAERSSTCPTACCIRDSSLATAGRGCCRPSPREAYSPSRPGRPRNPPVGNEDCANTIVLCIHRTLEDLRCYGGIVVARAPQERHDHHGEHAGQLPRAAIARRGVTLTSPSAFACRSLPTPTLGHALLIGPVLQARACRLVQADTCGVAVAGRNRGLQMEREKYSIVYTSALSGGSCGIRC
uniref:Uncharacterized protein n=1 Tax=Mycena chlorophos TaxID=658473 RepID=A0ABQ0L504_MYCCL|nr:predicted protein [Mycena chlorophos]